MAKLNKFFALKTNFQTDPDEIRSGVPSGGGSNSNTKASPVSLTMEQIREQILNLDAQLSKLFPNISADEMNAKKVAARQELASLAANNPAINFSQEDFAEAVGLSPAQAIAQYYGIDLDETYGDNRLKIGGGGLSLTDNVASRINNYAKENPDSGTFSTLDFSVLPDLVDASDVQVATNYDLLSPDQLVSELDRFVPRDRQVARVTQDTPAFTVADTLGTTMFDPISFPERTINRGVPVVTKGIDAQGNPTTGITMGTAAASPSGPTIGELDISAILPSTGMGINADGTGTATVGTQPTTGNIVASSADTLNMVDPGVAANPISTIDPNVLGTQGNTVTKGPITTVTPPTIDPPQQPNRAEVIQNLFNTSQTKDIAAQRIGDYAASVGGITAEEIAAAVQPVLGQQPTFGIDPNTGAADVLEAVDQFGYGQVVPGGQDYITQNPLEDITMMATPTLADQQARLQFLNTQDAAVGMGPYTEQEAAMRGLDYARRQGMSLADAGAAFDMSEDDVRAQADTLGIDLGALGFAHGGEVEDSRDAAVGSRLMAHAGIGSMQAKNMSSQMADSLDRIMARRK
tara:strand:+ start:1187 stop:2917 length:1731 start_codon:yes stop_codon:yes gene_type:complete